MSIVIIVDGIGCIGRALVHAFKKNGYEAIHVISAESQRSQASDNAFQALSPENLDRKSYIKTIFYEDMTSLLDELSDYTDQIKFVVPGFELGVLLADEISAELHLPGNDLSKSLARRHKYAMVSALLKAKLPAIPTISCDNYFSAKTFAHQQGYPVLIKPPLSVGSDGVLICNDEVELKQAFESLHLRDDFHGKRIDRVIVQAYIRGDEYAVNTVSFAGKHYIADIWRYRKLETTTSTGKHVKLYGEMLLLSPYQDEEFQLLMEYISNALDALGVRYGAANNEVFIQKDGSPLLVETNARMEGIDTLTLHGAAFEDNTAELNARAYADPAALDRLMPNGFRVPSSTLCRLKLVSYDSGILTDFNHDFIKGLSTYHGVHLRYPYGHEIQETVDLFTALGAVFLAGKKEHVEQDIKAIRESEKNGKLITVTPPVKVLPQNETRLDWSRDKGRRHFSTGRQTFFNPRRGMMPYPRTVNNSYPLLSSNMATTFSAASRRPPTRLFKAQPSMTKNLSWVVRKCFRL